jgi:Asp-tRNA(Asn)/Glu-tRNA(Gln) amidotransferase A subunit family amidase
VATAVIHQYFDRLEAHKPDVGTRQFRLSRAEYLDQYQRGFYGTSLLKGLPVAIKDIIDTASMPTGMG